LSVEGEGLERFLRWVWVCLFAGTRARELRERRWESCEKVWMASRREELERLRRAW